MDSSRSKGLFIVMEGADGVGKSTVLRKLFPRLMEAGGYKEMRFFHWKPVQKSVHDGCIPHTAPHNPRGTHARGFLSSFVYLGYHWITFWWGYLTKVRPVLNRGWLVIADRYTYDILLDPKRFRLKLPVLILRIFVQTLPHPNAVVALVAQPETIIRRKPELSVQEIAGYQQGLVSGKIRNCMVIDAESTVNHVVETVVSKLQEQVEWSRSY